MTYNISEIESFFSHYSPIGDIFTIEDVNYFISSIDRHTVPKFTYDTGATKLVIIPKDRDYVIKIPFTGYYSDPFLEIEECEKYFEFTGSTGDIYNDYCSAELNVYQKAISQSLDFIFVPITYINTIKGLSIYIQPKVDMYEQIDINLYSPSKKSIDKVILYRQSFIFNNPLNMAPISWVASLLDCVQTLEEYNKIQNFLSDVGIHDLHSGNVGYYQNKPVIIDYGSFHD